MGEPTSGLSILDQLGEAVPHLRVLRLAWDSPFRAAGVVPGDWIVGANGVALKPSADYAPGERERLPGNYQEAQGFEAAGLKTGDPLKLTIRRRRLGGTGWATLELIGKIGEKQFWQAADNTPIMGPGGPSSYDSAGFFSGGWGGWSDALQNDLEKILDPEQRFSVTTQFEAKRLRESHGDRVAAMAALGGPWASALKSDWDVALAIADGAAVTLPANALDFRRRGEELAGEVRAAGAAAWEEAKAAHAANTIPAFPAVDPSVGDVKTVAGKIVELPPLGNSNYVMDGGRTVFGAGASGDGWYLVDAEGEAAQAMLTAQRRFGKLVDPNIAARWQFLGTITGEPRLCVIGGQAYFGLTVEPLAALVGDTMFVDLTKRNGVQIEFAGEAGLVDDTPDTPSDDASPAQVVAAMVGAVKANDVAMWRALHADWWIEEFGDNQRRVHPHVALPDDTRFEDALRSVKGRVIDARVVWTDDPVVVAPAGRYPGAEAIEEVLVWLDHVGDFGAGPRVFSDVTVSERWRLQRIGGGPWRIAEAQSI